jgi:hypothetical protein
MELKERFWICDYYKFSMTGEEQVGLQDYEQTIESKC